MAGGAYRHAMAPDDAPEPREPTSRFTHLPDRVRPEDMVEEKDTSTPLPGDGGHDAEQNYVIRHLLA